MHLRACVYMCVIMCIFVCTCVCMFVCASTSVTHTCIFMIKKSHFHKHTFHFNIPTYLSTTPCTWLKHPVDNRKECYLVCKSFIVLLFRPVCPQNVIKIHIWRHWAIIGCRLAIQQNNAFTYNKHHVSVDKQGVWSNREVAKQMRQKRKWVSRQ